MTEHFEHKLKLGEGLYTTKEIAHILSLPYAKVNRWIDVYWDKILGQKGQYSWKVDKSKAVNFHTLVEFYVLVQFFECGVKPKKVLEAHQELAEKFETSYPFALKKVLDAIQTDGSKIFLEINENLITLDGSKQLNLDLIKIFFVKLDFDGGDVASRFWPRGRDKSVLIDPDRKFGHPILDNSNIYPETLFNHHDAGDPIPYIAHVYELTEQEVQDAIDFCYYAA